MADVNQRPLEHQHYCLTQSFKKGDTILVQLIGDERLDYLLAEKMRIIQSPSVFSFSLDAVLLARFVYVPIQKGNLLIYARGME